MGDSEEERALWARYRAASLAPPEPDMAMLAAYAEGKLDAAASEPVEAWLARHPEAFDGILAARLATAASVRDFAPPAEIAAARALVATLPAPRALLARSFAWSSVAAGLVAAFMMGYQAGSATKHQTLAALSNAAHDIGFVATSDGFMTNAMSLGHDAHEDL